MSSFAKRKARKITVQEDDDQTTQLPTTSISQDFSQEPALQAAFKSRPFKQSSLRQSINIADDGDDRPKDAPEDEEDGGAPLRVRPSLGGRAGSSKVKKRASSSRLSFGLSAVASGGDDDAMVIGEDSPVFTPKKSSSAAAALENSAMKRGITKNNRLPLRSMDTEEERPRYSKEYLSELQQSTPNTPANHDTLLITDDDDAQMSLDPSELEGATVVSIPAAEARTTVLTESEIREKKERRARLAQQAGAEDFISLSDDERGTGDSYLTLLSKRQPATISQKKEKRLVTDENLDEDDSFFVEDGGLSLGAKAEREARRKKRADMASMIAHAEGADEAETSDDSEAERRAAYEAAQTRAGMDGLAEEREQQRRRLGQNGAAVQIPPRITPLPDLSVLVEEFKAKMGRKELELQMTRARMEELKREREGIERREPEVQGLLNQTGERYRELMEGAPTADAAVGYGNGSANGDSVAAAKSLLEQTRNPGDTPGRGLESLGTTPLRAPPMEMEM
ncbi:nineteen complex-related protein 2-domain-containing protein [Xylariales sp. AK1849]|nr:nineteen complex-related protein 2-domain-containing protein [Xylariales sp. AK1849]